jgi:hypothetical protein
MLALVARDPSGKPVALKVDAAGSLLVFTGTLLAADAAGEADPKAAPAPEGEADPKTAPAKTTAKVDKDDKDEKDEKAEPHKGGASHR